MSKEVHIKKNTEWDDIRENPVEKHVCFKNEEK